MVTENTGVGLSVLCPFQWRQIASLILTSVDVEGVSDVVTKALPKLLGWIINLFWMLKLIFGL